jgi:hypothetical protein
MHDVGFAGLAAVVSNAGGLGIITGLTQRTPAPLANEIAKYRVLTGKLRDCQRGTGSAYFPAVPVKATDLKLAQGEPSWFERTADHGPVMRRGFCRDCGSTLLLVNGAVQGAMVLYAGRLEASSWYRPSRGIIVKSAPRRMSPANDRSTVVNLGTRVPGLGRYGELCIATPMRRWQLCADPNRRRTNSPGQTA